MPGICSVTFEIDHSSWERIFKKSCVLFKAWLLVQTCTNFAAWKSHAHTMILIAKHCREKLLPNDVKFDKF